MSLFSVIKQTKYNLGQPFRMFSMTRSCFDTKATSPMKETIIHNYNIYLNLTPNIGNNPITQVNIKILDNDIDNDYNIFKRHIKDNREGVMFKNIKDAPVTHYTYN